MSEIPTPEHYETFVENRLRFVNIPPLLSKDGAPQVAVFGSAVDLEQWRKTKGLDPEKFPVHEAEPGKRAMGTHIDIYGQEDIGRLIPQGKVTPFSQFSREEP